MPINKERERFAQEKLPFEIVSRDVVQRIKSPDALALWVYLLTLPPDWIPRREQLRERWELGKDRYAKAMQELRAMGLVWDAIVRDGQGRIIEKIMTVQAIMDDQRAHLCAGKPVSRTNPNEGESGHLKNKISIKEKDNKRAFTHERAQKFAQWWETYPKKMGKGRAWKLFLKLSDSDLLDCLKDNAALRYRDRERQYIPQGDTYLSQRKWEDEQDQPVNGVKQRWI